MEQIINYTAYTISILFILLILWEFVVKKILNHYSNQKEVNTKISKKVTPTTYHKFNYDGAMYFESPDQKSGLRLFKGFQRQQKAFGKMYDKARSKKVAKAKNSTK